VLRVGLTGGIACGKSQVLRRLQAAGLGTLDLDRVAHEVMAPGGAAYEDVVRSFGPAILGPDRTIDRRALGDVVFKDPTARARLNALVHPRVREEEGRRAAALGAAGATVIVSDAALLVEAGVHLRFDRLVVVHCPRAEQRRRLMLRDGLAADAAEARIAAQMPIEEKRRFAHLEVDTSGTLADTERAADALAAQLTGIATNPPPVVRVALSRALGSLVGSPEEGPRGLRPTSILSEIVAAGGPEMERLARLLSPPSSGPWYRAAARDAPPAAGPETLAAPLVLWSLGRGRDDEFLCAAAASTARLTHADASAIAGAVLFALGLAEALTSERVVPSDALLRWMGLATRWGGAPPPGSIVRLLETGDGQGSGAALAGAKTGVEVQRASPRLQELARALPGVRS
jgi:dephospho-CoA kinase